MIPPKYNLSCAGCTSYYEGSQGISQTEGAGGEKGNYMIVWLSRRKKRHNRELVKQALCSGIIISMLVGLLIRINLAIVQLCSTTLYEYSS